MQLHLSGFVEKAAKLQEGEVEVIVSTNAVDSYNERIDISGISTKDFMKNPVVLYGHDSFNLPIARATKIWKDGNKLMARAQFYLKDEFPRKVYDYVQDGFINAVSIGGMVKQWSDDGQTIEKLDMKEFSFVPIPANQEALVVAKGAEEMKKFNASANLYARKQLGDNPNQLLRDIETLENMTATLKALANSEPNGQQATHRRVVLRTAQSVDKQAEKIIKVVKKEVS